MTMTDAASAVPAEPPAQPTDAPTPTAGDDRLRTLEARVRDLEQQVQNIRVVGATWILILVVLAGIALTAAIVAIGAAMRAIDEAEQTATIVQAVAGTFI